MHRQRYPRRRRARSSIDTCANRKRCIVDPCIPQGPGLLHPEERTALTGQTIEAKNIVAAFDPDGNIMMSNNWIIKKSLTREDVEMYDAKIHEFADAFFNYVNTDQQSKEQSEKDTSTEAKKRRRSTDQDENDEENMEPSGERSVKPKVTMEYHNPENLEEFIKEFKVTYLEMDMTKKDSSRRPKATSPASWRSTTGIHRELIPN